MIPVEERPEPADFDAKVRKPGVRWLKRHRLALRKPVPKDLELPPYWRKNLDDLHHAYAGVCAYLCIFLERVSGSCSVDHFIAKSKAPGLAYEWSNYRLACSTMNARKHDFDTVLDPFTLTPGTFHLELVLGRIYPNPKLVGRQLTAAQKTITRLGLDDAACRELRERRFTDYLAVRGPRRRPVAELQLLHDAPFLYQEARRQRLL